MPNSVGITADAIQQADLASADRQATVEAFSRISANFSSSRWLGLRNRYQRETVERIDIDAKSSGSIRQRQLADYIAASPVGHLGDGWGYLGRSINSLLVGDSPTARHLAYYAELRAAIAILACHGIGVFNNHHFVQTGPATVRQVGHKNSTRTGTHKFAWVALNWWTNSGDSKALIEQMIRPQGVDLATWFSASPKYGSWATVAADWIRSLGLDIQIVADDQFRRNEASYQPGRVGKFRSPLVEDDAAFVGHLWRALEPTTAGSRMLDMQMLRIIVERSFHAVEAKTPRMKWGEYLVLAGQVAGVAGDPPVTKRLEKYLLREIDHDDHPLLVHAARQPSTSAGDPRGMMSRAALLLSFATSAVRQLVLDAGADLEEIEFWWAPLGHDRGIWDVAPPIGYLRDLWSDFEIEVEALEAWVANPSSKNRTDLFSTSFGAFGRLSLVEIAALWGVAV